MATKRELWRDIEGSGPCGPARNFLREFDDWQAAWDACKRADWMSFLLYHYLKNTPANVRRLCRLAFDHYEACGHFLQANIRPVIDPFLARLRDWAYEDGDDLYMVSRKQEYATAVRAVVGAATSGVIPPSDGESFPQARNACRCLMNVILDAAGDDPDVEYLADCVDSVRSYATSALTREATDDDYVGTQTALSAAACDRIRKHFPNPPLPKPKADTPETVPAAECD